MKFSKLAILVASSVAVAAWADSSASDATWKSRSVKFTYSGSTTRYSCNGLHEKVRRIVLAMAARKEDLRIDDVNCGPDASQPSAVLSLNITLATLQPAAAGDAKPVPAHWKRIDVGQAAQLDRGDCELIGQVRDILVPLFATRGLDVRDIGCIPGNSPTGMPTLKLDVLVPGENEQML